MGVSAEQLLLICLIMTGAGAVQGAVGFGSGLLAVGLMSPILGVRQASIAFCLPALIMCVSMLLRLREHFRWRRVAPVAIGLLAGVPMGVWFLVRAQPRILEVCLGILMVLTVAYNLAPRLARRRWHPYYVGIPCGLLSGALSGAFSTGGPPLVAYLSTQQFDRMRFAATLQVFFVINATLRLVELTRRGLLTAETVRLGLVGAAALVGGSFLGMFLLKRLSDRLFRRIVLGMLVLLAVWYLLPH